MSTTTPTHSVSHRLSVIRALGTLVALAVAIGAIAVPTAASAAPPGRRAQAAPTIGDAQRRTPAALTVAASPRSPRSGDERELAEPQGGCTWVVASAIYAMGAAGLGALALADAPVTIAGMVIAPEALGVLASMAGSFSAIYAWVAANVC